MKRAEKILKMTRSGHVKKKRKVAEPLSPVRPEREGEITHLMECLDENLFVKEKYSKLVNFPPRSPPPDENVELPNNNDAMLQTASLNQVIPTSSGSTLSSTLSDTAEKNTSILCKRPEDEILQTSPSILMIQDSSTQQMRSSFEPVYEHYSPCKDVQNSKCHIEIPENSQAPSHPNTDSGLTDVEMNSLLNLSITSEDVMTSNSPLSDFTIPSVGPQTPQSENVSPACSKTRHVETQNRPGKIRTRNYSDWKDLKIKALKNSGKKYKNRSGKEFPEKLIKPPCDCKKKCFEKVSEDQRAKIFKNFWGIGKHERQWDFIGKYVKQEKPKTIKVNGRNRTRVCIYSLPICDSSVIVCRTMFLNTLSISEKMVRTCLDKQNVTNNEVETAKETNPFNMTDMRGRHHNRPNKLPEHIQDSIIEHINSLEPIESHYCRKNSTRKFLDGHLSYTKLHKEYELWFNEDKYGNTKATQRQYQDVVNRNFNIAFHSPKKDQCDKCHSYNNLPNPTEEQKTAQNKHLELKEIARTLKKEDKSDAQKNQKIKTACFDMQKVLNCPHGEVSNFYYKRRLNLLNLTIYDMAKNIGYCYMWDEVTGKKGANEVGSGLLMFVKSMIQEGAEEFRFWSDNCSGQNRNRIIFALYQFLVSHNEIKSITHRFLEVGHTQNEGDSVHSVIEGATNNGRVIYTPEQWFNIIRWAKVTGEKFRVKNMTQDDILDFKSLLDGRNWLKNDAGEKVQWNKIKEVLVEKENPGVVKYKYELTGESHAITTTKKTRSKKAIVESLITKAYSSPIKLNNDKYKDLLQMCNSNIIPEEFSAFFKTLPHEQTATTTAPDSDNEEPECL